MTSFNPAFAEYATRVSFNLTLSRNQTYTLCLIARESIGPGKKITGFADNFVSGAMSLREKGLVEWTDPATMKPRWSRFPYTLTDAGKHVYELLKIAGIAERIPESYFAKSRAA